MWKITIKLKAKGDSPGREVVSLKTISQILKVNKQKVFRALFMVHIVFKIFIQYL